MLFRNIDDEVLVRLLQGAIDGAGNHLWLTNGQLEAFATHGLHQDGQSHFATALNFPGIRTIGWEHADGHVTDEFLIQASLHDAGGELVAATLACHWRGVHTNGHGDGWLVHGDTWQSDWVFWVSKGIADHDVIDAGDGRDITSDDLIGSHAGHANGAQQFSDLRGLGVLHAVFVVVDPSHLLALAQTSSVDTHQADASEEGGGVQVGNVCLQRRIDVSGRLWKGFVQHVEQWLEILGLRNVAVAWVLGGCLAFTAGAVQNREIQQLLCGQGSIFVFQGRGQLEEQVLSFIHYLVDAGIGTVGLIHTNDDGHLGSECLTQHEAGLRQWAFRSIHQQHHTVHHGQCALHLATEVGVAWGVNHVNDEVLAIFAGSLAANRGVLREDGDALFLFQVAGVHHAFLHFTVGFESTRLVEHGIHEGGLAMVNVCDNRDIAEFSKGHRSKTS